MAKDGQKIASKLGEFHFTLIIYSNSTTHDSKEVVFKDNINYYLIIFSLLLLIKYNTTINLANCSVTTPCTTLPEFTSFLILKPKNTPNIDLV